MLEVDLGGVLLVAEHVVEAGGQDLLVAHGAHEAEDEIVLEGAEEALGQAEVHFLALQTSVGLELAVVLEVVSAETHADVFEFRREFRVCEHVESLIEQRHGAAISVEFQVVALACAEPEDEALVVGELDLQLVGERWSVLHVRFVVLCF